MTHEDFKTCLEELDGQGAKTLAEKNARYSSSDDALHNFKSGAEVMGGTPAQACWGYMTKHLVSLRDMIQRNDFHNREDVLEKIQDSINYLRFIWAISEEERSKYTVGCQSEAVKTPDGYGECNTCEHEDKSEFEMPCVRCRNNYLHSSAKYANSHLFWEPQNNELMMINFNSEHVLQFIKKFSDFGNQVVDCFTKGNCYWFARILAIEFMGTIYYDPIVGHFATMIDGVLYDITGVVENTDDFISIEEIYEDELLWARLLRDCVDLGVGIEYEVQV